MDIDKAYGVDKKSAEKGKWMVTQEGLEVKVAKLGNPDFVAEVTRLQRPHLAILTSTAGDSDLNTEITIKAMAKTILKDWKVESKGKPVKYTVELGIEALTKYPDFKEDISVLSASRNNFKKELVVEK